MKHDSLLRSTTLYSIATLISRVLGLVRESCLAAFVDPNWQNIFQAGFKIPNTFRMLFAEGALSAAFIPMLAQIRERKSTEDAIHFSHSVFTFLLVIVGGLTLLAMIFSPWFVPFILEFNEEWKIQASVRITQIMFPFLFFVALAAWAIGNPQYLSLFLHARTGFRIL